MANPVEKRISENWKLISDNVTSVLLIKSKNTGCVYQYSYLLNGSDPSNLPEHGLPIFENNSIELLSFNNRADVYARTTQETGEITVCEYPALGQILSYSKDAILSTNYLDDYIVRGDVFGLSQILTIGAGVTLKLIVDFTAIEATRFPFVVPLTFVSSGPYFKIHTYNITNYTGGDILPLINSNELSAKTAQTVVKSGITSTDVAGNDKRSYIVGAGGNPASSRGGGGGAANILVINRTDKKCIEITNTGNASADIQVAFVVIESQAKI